MTISPMVPWPHMFRKPTLLKKMTPALAGGVVRLAEQCADDGVIAARLVDDGGANVVEIGAEAVEALLDRAAAEIRAAGAR